MFKFTINGTSSGRWYFFLDESWGYAYSEADCSKKLAMAKFDSKLVLLVHWWGARIKFLSLSLSNSEI